MHGAGHLRWLLCTSTTAAAVHQALDCVPGAGLWALPSLACLFLNMTWVVFSCHRGEENSMALDNLLQSIQQRSSPPCLCGCTAWVLHCALERRDGLAVGAHPRCIPSDTGSLCWLQFGGHIPQVLSYFVSAKKGDPWHWLNLLVFSLTSCSPQNSSRICAKLPVSLYLNAPKRKLSTICIWRSILSINWK